MEADMSVIDCYTKGSYHLRAFACEPWGVTKGMDSESYALPKQPCPAACGGVGCFTRKLLILKDSFEKQVFYPSENSLEIFCENWKNNPRKRLTQTRRLAIFKTVAGSGGG
jgi:hypothetical protein